MQISNLITTNRTHKKQKLFHRSIHYFIFSETPVVLEKYIWTLYMNTQSHWLYLFYLYKKHKQDRHYFMCTMIFCLKICLKINKCNCTIRNYYYLIINFIVLLNVFTWSQSNTKVIHKRITYFLSVHY